MTLSFSLIGKLNFLAYDLNSRLLRPVEDMHVQF